MRSLEEIGRDIESFLSTDEWKTVSRLSYESGMLRGAVCHRLRALKKLGRAENKTIKQRIVHGSSTMTHVTVWKLRDGK